MTDPVVLFTIGAFSITAYSLILLAAVVMGLLWMNHFVKKMSLPSDTAVCFGVYAIPLGLIGGRALFVAFRWSLLVDELGWTHIFRLWDGGFALFGVIPGCLLAAFFCAKRMECRVADVLDAAAPGAALALALTRFAELFTSQGIGLPVDTPALQWLPLAIQDSYGEWVMPVFLWEGIAALAVAWLAAKALHKPHRQPMDAASVWFLGVGVSQVLLESLRTDDILRMNLVKASQLFAMACVLAVAIRWVVQYCRAGKPFRNVAGRCAGLLVGVVLCVGIEFALDKASIPNNILYLIMALTLTGMVVLILQLRKMAVEAKFM